MKKLNECKVRTRSTKQNGENTASVEETGNASTRQVKKLRARCSIQRYARLFILSACLSALGITASTRCHATTFWI